MRVFAMIFVVFFMSLKCSKADVVDDFNIGDSIVATMNLNLSATPTVLNEGVNGAVFLVTSYTTQPVGTLSVQIDGVTIPLAFTSIQIANAGWSSNGATPGEPSTPAFAFELGLSSTTSLSIAPSCFMCGGSFDLFESQNRTFYAVQLQTFTALDNSGDYTFGGTIDSIEVAPPVPEPSTWAMLLIGFAGIGFATYRRQRGVMLEETAWQAGA
jgi:hypothetical protein